MEPQNSRQPFPDTPWSVIFRSQEPDSQIRQSALEELCRAYWPAVYTYARWKRLSPEDAEDLTQSFFVELIHNQRLEWVKPDVSRFRSWLTRCFANHRIDAHRKANAQKRGGDWIQVEITSQAGEDWWDRLELSQSDSSMDRIWALTLLQRALDRLRADCKRRGKLELFEQVRPHLEFEDDLDSYSDIALELGMSPASVAMAVHRLRADYSKLIRHEVGKTVDNPEDEAAEFAAIRLALA